MKQFKIICLIISVTLLASCTNNTNSNNNITTDTNVEQKNEIVSNDSSQDNKNEKPLKDDEIEAKRQVESSMKEFLDQGFGKMYTEVKFEKIKIYSSEDEKNDEIVNAYGLEPNEMAFEVDYSMKPAEGVSEEVFTVSNGELKDGWIINKHNCGVLRPSGEKGYKITNFGTGF